MYHLLVTCASTTQFIISSRGGKTADESMLNEKILIAFLSILQEFQQAQREGYEDSDVVNL